MSTRRDFTCHLVLQQHLTEEGKEPGKMEWQSPSAGPQGQAGPMQLVNLPLQDSKCLSQWVSTCRFSLMGKEAETAKESDEGGQESLERLGERDTRIAEKPVS